MTDKPCPRCINGPMPTWGNVDQVCYCDRHVGEILRGVTARIEAFGQDRNGLDGEATKAG